MAEGLLEAGCEVVIIGTRETIKDRADEFNQKGFKCTGVQADLGDEIALKEAFQESLAALGGHLDILVTAHGVQSRHPSEEFPMEDWKRVLDVNLTAVFELCQLAAKQFMAQESKGKIITVASSCHSLADIRYLHMRHPKAVWLRLPKHSAMNGQKKELM